MNKKNIIRLSSTLIGWFVFMICWYIGCNIAINYFKEIPIPYLMAYGYFVASVSVSIGNISQEFSSK